MAVCGDSEKGRPVYHTHSPFPPTPAWRNTLEALISKSRTPPFGQYSTGITASNYRSSKKTRHRLPVFFQSGCAGWSVCGPSYLRPLKQGPSPFHHYTYFEKSWVCGLKPFNGISSHQPQHGV